MTVEAASGGDLRLELFVEDIERSTAFYCDVLGFTREASSTGYVPVRLGRAVIGIGLMPRLPEGHPIKRCGMSAPGSAWRSCWRWQTSMRRAGARSMRERVHGPVQARPWGLRDFRLTDPDGHYVRVTSVG